MENSMELVYQIPRVILKKIYASLSISISVNTAQYFFNTILKKIDISFIVDFCLGKYSFNCDTFSSL